MTNLGKCVVFATECDDSATTSILGREGCLETVRMSGDGYPARLNQGYDVVVGLEFDKTEFGIVMNLSITSLSV